MLFGLENAFATAQFDTTITTEGHVTTAGGRTRGRTARYDRRYGARNKNAH